jgi:HEPN domain-containing protein
MTDDDDRTTPLGLFSYARSYWKSGVLLHNARAKVSHPDAPVTLLLAHAIELYLKAFLRLRGIGTEEVKSSFGHDFKKLVDEASSRGLALGNEENDIAAILTEQESIRRSRYIETGYYQRPGLAALSRTCQGLDQSVSAALKDAGMNIRSAELNHIESY